MSESESTESVEYSPDNRRQVFLKFPEKTYADFIIKTQHEKISFRRFFHILIDAFLRDDARIVAVLDEAVKEDRFKYQTEAIQKEREKMKLIKRQFRLDPKELEDIYDLWEDDQK